MKIKTVFFVSLLAMGALMSCNDLNRQVEDRLNELSNKAEQLDSLIKKEVDKVNSLDSIIARERNKIKDIDSIISNSSSKFDSIANEKIRELKKIIN